MFQDFVQTSSHSLSLRRKCPAPFAIINLAGNLSYFLLVPSLDPIRAELGESVFCLSFNHLTRLVRQLAHFAKLST